MSLIVETGTANPYSDSYVSVEEADAYFESIGNSNWDALSRIAKESALRRATNYMVQTYRLRWKGVRVNALQALDWPRYDVQLPDVWELSYSVISPTEVPLMVRRATAEFALLATTRELSPIRKQGVSSKTVGPIKIVYDQNSANHNQYYSQDKMLDVLLKTSNIGGSGAMVKLTRS